MRIGNRHYQTPATQVRTTGIINEAGDTGTGDFIRYYATDPCRVVLKPGVNQLLDLKLVTKSDM